MTNATSAPSALPVSHQVGIGLLSLAFLLGFPGNLFVVWTIVCRVTRRSLTCLLVLNLAVADALVLLSAPLFIRFLAVRGWEFGSGMCKTVHYLCCVNMYASIYLICLMSVDRWLAVTRPFLSQQLRTKHTLWAFLLVLWILSFVFALPMPFYRSNLQPFLAKNISVYICMPYHWESEKHETFQYLWETLLGFLLPFCLILACYLSIICRLRSAMFQRKSRGNRLIVFIIGAFALFWLPYHLINILQVLGTLQKLPKVLQFAKTARPNVTAFAFFSSSVNPILYVFAGSSYIRRAGLGFMGKLFEGTNSEGGSFSSRSTRSSRSGSSPESSTLRKLSMRFGLRGVRDEWMETGAGPDAGSELQQLDLKAMSKGQL
ncbi:leukotriene B4 receptor 1-like [Scleropages formosus]|uniref:Leukotriene B4 receptor 1-like n=1 Tax=Scleropages formosus TaxID=113540 RepID=A0A0P7TSI5_SCLFO|nr:leukotriene B4 receptor 1-like [Scleropages formosus]